MANIASLNITPKSVRWFNALLKRAAAGPISELTIITPEIAAILLSRNPGNRKIRPAKLEQYSRDMKAGQFKLNGAPIIVSAEGLLNDGQHRLYAAIQSRTSFTAFLTVGVARETRDTIDTGASRSAGDHLGLSGVSNANTASSIARYVLTRRSFGSYNRNGSISQQEQINLVHNDSLIRDIAAWVDSSKYRTTGMIKGSLLGFIHYMLSEKAPIEARAFMESFRTGADLPSDSPIYLVRERLRNTTTTDIQKIELIIRAWNHWCEGPTTKISRLQVINKIPEIDIPRGFMSLPFEQVRDNAVVAA